jgi:hypothetical protein
VDEHEDAALVERLMSASAVGSSRPASTSDLLLVE